MRWRRAAAAALGGVLLTACPARAAPPDVDGLQAQLAAVTARAQQLADQLEQSRSRDGGLRQAADDLARARDAAVARLDARVRELYIDAGPPGLAGWEQLMDPERAALAARGQAGGVRVDRQLVEAVATRSAAARGLQAQAAQLQAVLRVQAVAVLAEQDRARDLLDRAQQQAHQQAQGQVQEQAQQQAALDAVSATVTAALAPAPTARSRAAAADEDPLLALLEAAGSGYPAGYAPSGTVISGTASWYGPGFVGSPTASGRPYDPELLTCAHRTLPLGTVLHVTANGRSTNCLVDDRGPYVGDRVLDLSRAGSRALGYDGTAEVVAEVLETAPP